MTGTHRQAIITPHWQLKRPITLSRTLDPLPPGENTATVLVGTLRIRRCVVATHTGPPVLPGDVTLLQYLRTDTQVVIGIECLPWGAKPLLVIAPIDLHQADINGAFAVL